jgi:hypothetical protein
MRGSQYRIYPQTARRALKEALDEVEGRAHRDSGEAKASPSTIADLRNENKRALT